MEEEEIAVLVCSEADHDHPPFADNVFGPCECGTEIMWRPYNDRAELRKLCFGCALRLAEEANASGEIVVLGEPSEQGKAELYERVSQSQLERLMGEVKQVFGVKDSE